MIEITLASLTSGNVGGDGVFDRLMSATKAHLEDQFLQQRIKGPEYASVYLGQVQQVLQTAVSFLTFQQKANLEAQLLEQQILLAKSQVEQANAQIALTKQQMLNAQAELKLTEAQTAKVNAETTLIPKQALELDARTELLVQQKLNAVTEQAVAQANVDRIKAETLNVPKQGALLDSQVEVQKQQKLNLAAEALNIPKQGVLLTSQADVQNQQKANLTAEALNIPKQGLLIEAQTAMSIQQKANAILEGNVLVAQECKLKAEFDFTQQNTLKSAQETVLLTQKVLTEKAQITGAGVDADSVVGRQKALYQAQTEGFTRDAEQKVAKIFVDSWNTRRMTDDGVQANATNMLDDASVGRAVQKLLTGVNA